MGDGDYGIDPVDPQARRAEIGEVAAAACRSPW